jgi:hypothetical protein
VVDLVSLSLQLMSYPSVSIAGEFQKVFRKAFLKNPFSRISLPAILSNLLILSCMTASGAGHC